MASLQLAAGVWPLSASFRGRDGPPFPRCCSDSRTPGPGRGFIALETRAWSMGRGRRAAGGVASDQEQRGSVSRCRRGRLWEAAGERRNQRTTLRCYQWVVRVVRVVRVHCSPRDRHIPRPSRPGCGTADAPGMLIGAWPPSWLCRPAPLATPEHQQLSILRPVQPRILPLCSKVLRHPSPQQLARKNGVEEGYAACRPQ